MNFNAQLCALSKRMRNPLGFVDPKRELRGTRVKITAEYIDQKPSGEAKCLPEISRDEIAASVANVCALARLRTAISHGL